MAVATTVALVVDHDVGLAACTVDFDSLAMRVPALPLVDAELGERAPAVGEDVHDAVDVRRAG